jgi:hypothetical protein
MDDEQVGIRKAPLPDGTAELKKADSILVSIILAITPNNIVLSWMNSVSAQNLCVVTSWLIL